MTHETIKISNFTYEMNKIQESLKQKHSLESYNKIIKNLKDKSGNDIEILSYMANDKMLSPEVGLFAIAAMGE